MTDYQRCSKKDCGGQVLTDPDFSQPTQRYERYDKNNVLHYVISYPHKDIERPAWCYFHRTFPNYPQPEPFERTNMGKE